MASKLRGIFKLRIKIADREFEAEAPPNVILDWLRDFRAMAAGQSEDPLASPRPGQRPDAGLWAISGGRTLELQALFECDADGEVRALQVLPTGRHREADAALLMLLGYKRLRGREHVPVIVLKQALRRSGASVVRLDRTLAAYLRQQLVMKTGSGKGGRYRLTQEGLKRAETLSQDLRRLVAS